MAGSDNPDVLVIGGGIVGLFSAYFLRLGGASVTVAERSLIGDSSACSYGNTGFVAHGGVPLAEPGAIARGLRSWLRPDGNLAIRPALSPKQLRWLRMFRRSAFTAVADREVLTDMKNRSLAILRGLGEPLATHISSPGMLVAFKSETGFARACRGLPDAVSRGVPVRAVTPNELRALEPDAIFDVAGALYNEGASVVHAPEFLVAFAALLTGMGVDIRERSEVVGFDVGGSAVTRVRTASGELRPSEVVVAAGAWSPTCARMLDLDLPIMPVKGYSITIKTPQNAPRRPVLLSEGTVAVRPLGDRLRLAGSLEFSADTSQSRRRVESILATVRRHLPRLEISERREVWIGFRPCTPDSLPYIGRSSRHGNVAIAAGHGHIGMGLAPESGRLLAQIVRGEQPDIDVTPLRVDRFGRGHRG